jgi:carboxypeptidase PM20D1
MLKRILLFVLALLLLLVAAVAVNTLRQGSRRLEVAPAAPLALDTQAIADKQTSANSSAYHQLLRNLNAPAP